MHSDVDLLVWCSDQPSPGEIEDLVNATYPLYLECGRQLSPQFRTRASLESPTTPVGRAFLEAFCHEGRLLFVAE